MFHLDPNANISGTAYVDSVRLPPAFLVARFGPPRRSDGYKVSGQYIFTDARGNVFTVHDWKTTSLYDSAGENAPTPGEFWADHEPYSFSIGGHGEENDDGVNLPATAFREWLLEQYRGYHSAMAN